MLPLLRLARVLAGIVLGLALAAGMLYAGTTATSEYLPTARAALGLSGMALGYLLGQAARPLSQWRPPVPLMTEIGAPPAESPGRGWLRSFAAGFWALAAWGIAASLLFELLVLIPVTDAALLPAISSLELVVRFSLCLIVPLAVARGMVAEGRGLPPWAFTAAALGAFSGGLGLLALAWALASVLDVRQINAIDDVTALLGLTAIASAALGTPVLAQGLCPRLEGPAWSGVLALLALDAAGFLYWRLGAWLYQGGTDVALTWLGMSSLVWGCSLGALLMLMVARRWPFTPRWQ
jgi:MFS family permease